MTRIPQGLRYFLKILVALTWSLVGSLFLYVTLVPLLIAPLAVQPEFFATHAIAFVSSLGFLILCGMLTGMMSLLLWHRSVNKLASLLLAMIVPALLSFGAFAFAMSDTQGVLPYVLKPAESGDLKTTREQLLIQSRTVSQSKQLIQLGTNVNARDPLGHSALYSASWEGRDPEILKLLLQSGAKPDALALRHAIAWGRLDAIQLMFSATSDDGKALIAELGKDALEANRVRTKTSDADRAQINQLLIAHGATPPPQ